MEKVRKNLERALENAGINMAEASRLLGKNHAYIQQFVKSGKPYRLPEIVRIRLAKMLNIDEASLGAPNKTDNFTLNVGPQITIDQRAPYKGEVAAGAWLEQVITDENKNPPMVAIPTNKYRGLRQYYMIVRGDSLNNVVKDGDYVFCVDFDETRQDTPEHDTFVVVECSNDGKTEYSIKKVYSHGDDDFELRPDSTNPIYKPFTLTSLGEHIKVRITGVVIGSFDKSKWGPAGL